MALRHSLITWLLLFAVALPLAQPAGGSWHCPDGKLCVSGAGGHYQCAGDTCGMPCCAAAGGCGSRCHHGAFPALQPAGTHPDNAAAVVASGCRFTPTARILAADLTRTRPQLHAAALAFSLPPPCPAPACEPRGAGYLPTPDSSPPHPPGLPPSGLRAPPSV